MMILLLRSAFLIDQHLLKNIATNTSMIPAIDITTVIVFGADPFELDMSDPIELNVGVSVWVGYSVWVGVSVRVGDSVWVGD